MSQSAEGRVSLADALARLGNALDVLAGVDLAAVTDAELVEGVQVSRRLLLRLRCLDAAIAGRFDASAAWAGEARSVTGWLAQHAHAPVGETQARLRLAQDAARHPVMGAAVAAGEVAVEHLRELAATHRRLPALAAELDAVEDVITDYARQATPAQLRTFLDQLTRSIAPDVVDDAEKNRLEDRAHLSVTELLDGWVAVSAMLPPELGGRFLTALRALMLPATTPATTDGPADDSSSGSDTDWDTDTDTDTDDGATTGDGSGGDAGADDGTDGPVAADLTPDEEVLADPPPGDDSRDDTDTDHGTGSAAATLGAGDQSRPLRQRMLDALDRMLDYLADTRLDGTGFPRLRGHLPTINVTLTLDDLTTPPGDGVASLLSPAARGPVVIPADTARKHACDATIRRLILDPAGVPLDVGRRQRTVSPALAAAVQQRDRHCRWPGCRHRIDHAHHVVHWAHGGTTDLSNLLGLCTWHHHVAHSGDWTLHGNANTQVTIQATSGGNGRGHGGGSSQLVMTSRPPDDQHLTDALDQLRE